MAAAFLVVLLLLALAAICTLAANRAGIPAPVVLTLVGILLGSIPSFPAIRLEPDLVLLGILPPLVYAAAVRLPWEEFRANIQSISSLALGLVAASTTAVAGVIHVLVPGLNWGEAFALGAIISPTDPVASTAVSERVGAPRRLIAIIEGEGLLNDAVSLTILRIAVAAIISHTFLPARGVGQFLAIVAGETVYGIALGWGAAKLRKRIADPDVEITLSLLTPFAAYLLPQSLGGSGVLATVATGMYIGIESPELVPSGTRLHIAGVWEIVVYLLNGILFLLTGLQFRTLFTGNSGFSGWDALSFGAIVTTVVVSCRFAWTWATAGISRYFGNPEQPLRPHHLGFLSWCGMRGGISLAAALSLPHAIPNRALLITVTACVIAGTLIIQGASLPWILRWLGLDREADQEREAAGRQEIDIRAELTRAGLAELESYGDEADRIRGEYRYRLATLKRGEDPDVTPAGQAMREKQIRAHLAALAAERRVLIRLLHEGRVPEHVSRRIERDLDLSEVRLRGLLE